MNKFTIFWRNLSLEAKINYVSTNHWNCSILWREFKKGQSYQENWLNNSSFAELSRKVQAVANINELSVREIGWDRQPASFTYLEWTFTQVDAAWIIHPSRRFTWIINYVRANNKCLIIWHFIDIVLSKILLF